EFFAICEVKMKRALFLILALVFFLPAPAALSYDEGWTLVMDRDGIKAYMREVEGSPIKEIRAVTTIAATLENIGEVLRDVPANVEWQAYCTESELMKMHHRNKLDLYIALGLPWPVTDREILVRTETHYDLDAGRAIVGISTFDDPKCQPRDGRVRVTDLSGTYVFEYLDRYKTGIIYTYRIDMAGRIPVWLINFMGKYTLYDTFKNLRKMVAKPKYIEAGLNSVDREICESILNDDEKVRTVFRTRLNEFICDQEFIAELVNDDDMLVRFFNPEDGLAEVLLFGWGSVDSKREAIRQILGAYLPKKLDDQNLARSMANDENLVEAILRCQGSAMEIIAAAALSGDLVSTLYQSTSQK
ncbi:MAG: START domain-containing protein, partial [Desulfatibacillaceae bacterium]|nr:START domain-containing protein [Desulfatibacillaceae bacterium]